MLLKSIPVAVLCALLVDAQYQGQQADCRTPQGLSGRCVGIRQCQPLLNILQSQPLRPEAIDFLTRSQCGFEGRDPRVCCGISQPTPSPTRRPPEPNRPNDQPGANQQQPSSDGQPEISTNINHANLLSGNPVLPSECGKDLSQRIVGGERTQLDEFPWMALLEYQKPNGRTTGCGGVLISKRYVMTAAHCIKGADLPSTWRLINVRLGEYDTDSERDCVSDGEDTVDCADDPVSVGIEEQIAHEEYRPQMRDQRYDIALLRLTRDVPFTRYIKPICLPPTASYGQKLYVAGWGKTETRSASNIKLKLAIPLADKEQCARTYNAAGVRLGYGQICAGGQRAKDSCRGDSGGPLMALERNRDNTGKWVAVGVVSFGPDPCGIQGWPGVYTRVVDFVPWIISKMRP